MAGQPQDPAPSWQPAGQDQAREAWPPAPSFTPQAASPQESYPSSSPSPQDTYIYPPAAGYGQQGQAGQSGNAEQTARLAAQAPLQERTQLSQPSQPGQGYPPPTYTPPDQAQGMPYAPPDQGIPQWQANANPGRPAGGRRAAASGDKGFLGSLFDFSFSSMVTPKIIKVLYILIVVWVALLALGFLAVAFSTGGIAGGLFVLIIVDPILVLLSLGVYRVVLELCMVIFRLHEDVKAIRDRGEGPR